MTSLGDLFALDSSVAIPGASPETLLSALDKCLADGANPNELFPTKDGSKFGPLHLLCIAAKYDSNQGAAVRSPWYDIAVDAIHRLCEASADPNLKTAHGQPVLYFAALTKRIEIIEALIAHGGDVNLRQTLPQNGKKLSSPLDQAQVRSSEFAIQLMMLGASRKDCDSRGWCPPLCAARVGQNARATVMLLFVGDLQQCLIASSARSESDVRSMSDEDVRNTAICEINARAPQMDIPRLQGNNNFLLARVFEQVMIKDVTPKSKESDEVDNSSSTRDNTWSRNGHVYNYQYSRMLVGVSMRGPLEVVQQAIDGGGDPNFVDRTTRRTALFVAAVMCRSEVVKLLLKAGADPTQEVMGEVPLLRAIGSRRQASSDEEYLATLHALAETRRGLNAPSSSGGMTCLHGASSIHTFPQVGVSKELALEAVRILLQNGASLNVQDKNGLTPYLNVLATTKEDDLSKDSIAMLLRPPPIAGIMESQLGGLYFENDEDALERSDDELAQAVGDLWNKLLEARKQRGMHEDDVEDLFDELRIYDAIWSLPPGDERNSALKSLWQHAIQPLISLAGASRLPPGLLKTWAKHLLRVTAGVKKETTSGLDPRAPYRSSLEVALPAALSQLSVSFNLAFEKMQTEERGQELVSLPTIWINTELLPSKEAKLSQSICHGEITWLKDKNPILMYEALMQVGVLQSLPSSQAVGADIEAYVAYGVEDLTSLLQRGVHFSFLKPRPQDFASSGHSFWANIYKLWFLGCARCADPAFHEIMRRVVENALLSARGDEETTRDAYHRGPVKKYERCAIKEIEYAEENDIDIGPSNWIEGGICGLGMMPTYEQSTVGSFILDANRAAVYVRSAAEMMAVVDALMSLRLDESGAQVLRLKNGFNVEAKGIGGYRDVKFNVIFQGLDLIGKPITMIGELQIMLLSFEETKKHMHLLYALHRGDFN